jgi:hypothetical protein
LHWPAVFSRVIASMILAHVVLIGVLILRKSPAAAVMAYANAHIVAVEQGRNRVNLEKLVFRVFLVNFFLG